MNKSKIIYCTHYNDPKKVTHCESCHNEDQFITSNYKDFKIVHCCMSLFDIEKDIDYHEEGPENNCE